MPRYLRTGGVCPPFRLEKRRPSARSLSRAASPPDLVERLLPFLDMRVTSITNDAIAGANPIALMTEAGHANMATTKRYLRLAGVVFAEEAEALERRLPGGAPSTHSLPDSHDLTATDVTEDGLVASNLCG
jgi:hypothetical protein